MKTQALVILITAILPAALDASAAQADRVSLAGTWRFELDRSNAGIEQKWFERALPQKIKLPGSLPAQGVGDEIAVDTKWTGDIVDKSWFTAPEYAKYRQPGNIKVPFWLQPEKVLQRRGLVPARHRDSVRLEGQTGVADTGAATLGDALVGGWPGNRHERQPFHAA